MKKLKFLAGIPRSGSTLLTSLLNQRPDTYASNTSNLADMLRTFEHLWETNPPLSATAQTDGLKKEEGVEVLKQYRYGKIDCPADRIACVCELWVLPMLIQSVSEPT